ncbi:general secretion pathway protein C [Diaphorobacter aerolatus]|uniref:General secretion pathway protein C n=1 Tax=Diaphorobacter aerolatus TaxID=1288495 RepID=A0A7H0GNM0_9BURK|nr:type II secretion system protein N [Diaphorobacter aerolatus]QNP49886.1 general secretion pathway protein C [Diaphorobacter aerolatus]
MVTNTYSRWKVSAGTFVLWFLAIACVVFWGLRLSASPLGQGAPALPSVPTVVDVPALVRLLGGTEVVAKAAPVEPTRYTLVGVLAGTRSGRGAALIEVDGKPAKPFRIGAQVADGLVLQSVNKREARLGAATDGPVSMTLQMPLKVVSSAPSAFSPPSVPAVAPPAVVPVTGVQSPMMPQGTTPGISPMPTATHPAQGQ